MYLFLWTLICGLVQILDAQYVNLWTDSMDTNNGWTGYNNFNLTWSYVTAYNNEPSYIEKSTNITFYSSIQFQLDITAHNHKETDYCQIWYNFDHSAYIKHSEFEWSHSKYTNVHINFPQSIIANIIYIKLQVIGNNNTCFWNNATLRGIRIPVQMPNITTNSASYAFSSATNPSILFTIAPILCCIVIVIIRLICNKISNKKHSIESSLSHTNKTTNINIQNLEKSMMEIMSTLQLSEYDILSYQSKYLHDQNKQFENYITDMHSTNTITNITSDQWITPLALLDDNKNVSLSNIENISNTSDDMVLERPRYHNYPTMTSTPAAISITLTDEQRCQFPQANAPKSNDAKNSLSFNTLQRILELQMEILQEIIDDNKYECSFARLSMDGNTEHDSIWERIIQLETITDTNDHLDVKYMETFL